MARSKWKYISFSRFIWKGVLRKKKRNRSINLDFFFKRNSVIPECLSNRFVKIHKGNLFVNFYTLTYAIGYKFGEFSFTRKPYHYPQKKNRK